jgi:hypothetical protein
MPEPERSVHCARTIQPAKADQVLTAELCRHAQTRLQANQEIVVELGWRDFETDAANVLAWYLVEGHPVTIRGKRHENELRALVETFAANHARAMAADT